MNFNVLLLIQAMVTPGRSRYKKRYLTRYNRGNNHSRHFHFYRLICNRTWYADSSLYWRSRRAVRVDQQCISKNYLDTKIVSCLDSMSSRHLRHRLPVKLHVQRWTHSVMWPRVRPVHLYTWLAGWHVHWWRQWVPEQSVWRPYHLQQHWGQPSLFMWYRLHQKQGWDLQR